MMAFEYLLQTKQPEIADCGGRYVEVNVIMVVNEPVRLKLSLMSKDAAFIKKAAVHAVSPVAMPIRAQTLPTQVDWQHRQP